MANFPFRARIPDKIPEDMEKVIAELKKSKNKLDFLMKAYSFLTKKYKGYRFLTYLKLFNLFDSVEKIWKSRALHCTNLNYLMRIFLVKSGFFEDKEIEQKWTLVWFISPHQYLRVKIGNKKYDIDIWGKSYGIKFGDHAWGFH